MFMYSPRMWRWSSFDTIILQRSRVFSTYVEVIPISCTSLCAFLSILHVCGGDPAETFRFNWWKTYSPRMWRWSQLKQELSPILLVFSTYVEVIPTTNKLRTSHPSILHVCGGDPYRRCWPLRPSKYSPRMWRWSSEELIEEWCGFRILHVCGGDPQFGKTETIVVKYSPRMWRWSSLSIAGLLAMDVFSTYVEVIPNSARLKQSW